MQNITLPEKIVIVCIVILLILLGTGGMILYNNLHKNSAAAPHSELSPQALLESVSKLAELPSEQPTIATVTDKDKLAKFPFFSQAQLGDRVLIFNEAKKAYLYRPSSNKIVEVGPIMISEATELEITVPDEEASAAAVQTKPPTVTLLNGTKGKGVALSAEKDLKDQQINVEVKTKGNSKKNYTKTQIAVLNQESKSTAEQLAQIWAAEIIELPNGEVTPSTDIVVFLGTDRL